jgi:hypothetical protein
MAVAVSSLPEQGQLVSVRSRQWIVTEVRASTLPPPALKPNFSGPQHLLTLSSVEDDSPRLFPVEKPPPELWAVRAVANDAA